MKYVDKPSDCFIDRRIKQPELDPVDVIMLTLDADNFLDKCLFTVYREIPVRKLFVCDGGSKDDTTKILEKYPRAEVHVRPDIRTTGKAMEFLMSLTETNWFVLIDADIELSIGWYDEMSKSATDFDVIESGKRILAYHIYKEDTKKSLPNVRSYDLCHLIRRSAVTNFRCDDDYMWRYTDIMLRQVAEKSDYKYGKVTSSLHVHNETERIRYESDKEKSFQKVVWSEPRIITTDAKKAQLSMEKNAKAVVKYLDPNFHLVDNDKGHDRLIKMLNRNWVAQNGSNWLKKYDETSLLKLKSKRFIRKILVALKGNKVA